MTLTRIRPLRLNRNRVYSNEGFEQNNRFRNPGFFPPGSRFGQDDSMNHLLRQKNLHRKLCLWPKDDGRNALNREFLFSLMEV